MQYTIKALVVLAISGLAAAQIPACAQSCIDAATTKVGCGTTDYACACTAANQAAIQTDATTCVVAACGADVALNQVLPAAQALCASKTGSSSASAASTTAASAASSAAATTSAAATSAAPTSTSVAVVSTSSSAAASTTAAPTLMTSTTVKNSTATSTSAVQVTNGAGSSAASLGGVFALGLAVLAAF